MPIEIVGVSGHHEGKRYEFDEHETSIGFGRSSVNDIQFPADDTSISRQHLSLQLENDRYQVAMQADNPVFINGEEAYPDDELPLGKHRLTVGLEDSPEQFEIVITSQDEGLAVTEPSYKIKQSAAKQHKSLRKKVTIAIAALAVIGFVGYKLLDETSNLLDKQLQLLAAQSEKANVLARFEDTVLSQRDSVYLVAIKSGERLVGQGTAWVVGDGVLATNAHVVEGLQASLEDASDDTSAVVISPQGPDNLQHTIIGMELHPHWDMFSEHQTNVYRLMDDGSELDLTPAYDVALLSVDRPDALAAPLKIADNTDLYSLDSGAAVAFVGYPMEDAIGGGFNYSSPTPQVQFGAVTSVTDYFMVKESEQRNHLIQHSLPAHGGASGSPIFNVNGEVVALFNAGNVVFVEGHRVATGIGVNFAQRADILNEMLNDNVAQIEPQRLEFWGQRLSDYKTPAQIIVSDWRRMLASNGVDISNIQKNKKSLVLTEYLEEYEVYYWEGQINVEPGKQKLVIAEPVNLADIDLVWFDRYEDAVVGDNGSEPFAIGFLDEDTDWQAFESNNLMVYSAEEGVSFNLYVYTVE